MAYQFAHTQTFSRRGTPAGKSKGKGRGVTVGSRPISDVVNEAVRTPGHHPHVSKPKPHLIVYGECPLRIPEMIEKRIEDAKQQFPHLLKGKGKGIRKDQHILECAVYSHPAELADLDDPEINEQYLRWRDDIIEWAKRDFEKRGLEFVSAVEHIDEKHPHIHAYGIPKATESNPRMDAKKCHAGHAARAAEPEPKRKNAAYKRAMRQWQDDHHAVVGERHGLLRFGPRRQRIDRKSYMIQKAAAKDLARKIEMSEEMGDLNVQVNALKEDKTKLQQGIASLRAKFDELYESAIKATEKFAMDPIQYIKDHFTKPVEDERDQLSSENARLKSQLNALKNVRDERSKIVIENTLHELEMGIDRTQKNAPESPSGVRSDDFTPR